MKNLTSFEDFVNEGSHNRLVGELSRECIDAIKKNQRRYLTSLGLFGKTVLFEFNWSTTDEYFGIKHGGYFVAKEWSGKKGAKDTISISVEIGIEVGYKISDLLSKISYTLKNVIAHELEHAAQMRDMNRTQINLLAAQKSDGSVGPDYLLLPHEIAAFAKGIYFEAKSRKMPFSDIARDLVTRYQSAAKDAGAEFSDMDVEKVIIAWENWAKRNVPKAVIYEPDFMNEDNGFGPGMMFGITGPGPKPDRDPIPSDKKKEKGIMLNEIGDSSAKPFKWFTTMNVRSWLFDNMLKTKDKKVSGSSEDMYHTSTLAFRYEFTSDTTGTKYHVHINGYFGKNFWMPFSGNKPKNWKPYHCILGLGFGVDGKEGDPETNLNEQFRVMATVVECALDFIQKVLDDDDQVSIKEFHMSPKLDKDDQKGLDSRRGKLYGAYIKNAFKKLKTKNDYYIDTNKNGFVLKFGKVTDAHGKIPSSVIASTFEMKNIPSFESFLLESVKKLQKESLVQLMRMDEEDGLYENVKDLESANTKIEDLPKGKIFDDAKRIEGVFKKSKRTWHEVIGAFETNKNSAKPATINVKDIHITQPNIQSNKVKGMLNSIDKLDPINVVEFENGEYAIYDGHHRLLAHWALDEKKIKVNLVKL
jgi:hypothetical protein